MRPPRVRLTVQMLMVMVAIVAISLFLYETFRRTHGVPLDHNSGRFLVFVKRFTGPSARSQAAALAFELRYRHGLPAYLVSRSELVRLRPSANRRKKSPGQATEMVAVVIGECQTVAESQAVLKQVRKIQSNTIASLAGKLRPLCTSNPYLPATGAKN